MTEFVNEIINLNALDVQTLGHPLASQCQVSTTSHGDLGRHQFKSFTRSQLLNHARFFKSWLRRIAPDTHLDQACGSTAFANSPGGIAAPEEHWCRHVSKRCVDLVKLMDNRSL